MTVLEVVVLLLIAGVCGAIGQSLAGLSGGGCLTSIALGFIGAFLGAWIARALALPEPFAVEIGGAPYPILWAIVGSALFVAVLGALTRGARRTQA